MRSILIAIAMLLLVSSASAQVIYLPVQYQYGQDESYYYGGSDPQVFASAERTSALLRISPVTSTQVRVYSDLLPYWNAALFGLTPTDARNEAYLSQPRYFRKGDLLGDAVEINGTYYIPPVPPTRRGRPMTLDPISEHRPAQPKRGVIIIIPKKNLERTQPVRPAMFVSASR